MKVSLCSFLVLCIFIGVSTSYKTHGSSESGVQNVLKQWQEWKLKFEKSYETETEEQYRFGIWQANLKYVTRHNGEEERGLHTFRVGMNHFADMTNAEFRAQMLGNVRMLRKQQEDESEEVEVGDLPAHVDWREYNWVTPVKNQGQCGSCWSFSTTGGVEGQHARVNHELVSLSEQQLVDCSKRNLGCNGGNVVPALSYLKQHGSESEQDYPYTGVQGSCKAGQHRPIATVRGSTSLPGKESALQKAVAQEGPISVAVDASHPSFQMYSSGIYSEPKCSSRRLDHAVLAVGYGTQGGRDYWLIKNSWSPSWGEQGYMQLARNDHNMCGVATDACYPIV